MVNVDGLLSKSKRGGGTFTSVDGVEFEFYPTISILAEKAMALSNSIKSTKVPLEQAVREVIRPSIATNFAVGGRPKWAPLQPTTVKRKGSSKVNIERGTLARVAAQRNIWDINRTTAVVRGGALLARVPYALFVQAGHGNGSKVISTKDDRGRNTFALAAVNTPARPYLMIQAEDAEKIKLIFSIWLDSRIAKTWGS